MTLERDQRMGNDAKHLLENQLFQGAFKAVGDYIESKACSCDPDNKEQAQRIILSKQILAGVKREIERQVETGLIAEVQLAEIAKKRGFSIFQR